MRGELSQLCQPRGADLDDVHPVQGRDKPQRAGERQVRPLRRRRRRAASRHAVEGQRMTRAAVAEPGSQTTGADKTGAGKTSAETAGAAAPAVVETKGLSLVFQTAEAPVPAPHRLDPPIRPGEVVAL